MESKLFILEANQSFQNNPIRFKGHRQTSCKISDTVNARFYFKDVNFTKEFSPKYQAVKEAVLPFKRFPGSDTLLGPEMRSTGEVMGLAKDFGIAYVSRIGCREWGSFGGSSIFVY